MDQTHRAEPGERVLQGSRRPDGTLRKERRIRAGYIPQDEQQVYVSMGSANLRNIPKCPGLDEAAISKPSGPSSKAGKKNEKRKLKKQEEGAAATSSTSCAPVPKPSAAPPPAVTTAPAATSGRASVSGGGSQAGSAAAEAAPGSADVADPAATLDKQIKALRKKLRQGEALVLRGSMGETLTPQEADKVSKMPGWSEEVAQLQHQLEKLTASG